MRDNAPTPLMIPLPREYNAEVLAGIFRRIELYLATQQEVGPIRVSSINISNLPTSATGLRPGDLWNDTGTVKVVT